MATLVREIDERARIEEALEPLRLPKGVQLVRFERITDSVGDPAYRFFFSIPKSYSLEKRALRALNDVRDQIFNLLLPLSLDRWPYVRFVEVD